MMRGDIKNAIIASTPGGIEAQEAEGQQELVFNSKLPISTGRPDGMEKARDFYEKSGIRLGKPGTGQDKIFIEAFLPEGWCKKATDHSMWSQLLDDKGRERATIFFKAAFYDYNSHLSPSCRFTIGTENGMEYDGSEKYDQAPMYGVVKDAGNIIYQTEPVDFAQGLSTRSETREERLKYYALEDDAKALLLNQCRQWLIDRGLPDFNVPTNYWDV